MKSGSREQARSPARSIAALPGRPGGRTGEEVIASAVELDLEALQVLAGDVPSSSPCGSPTPMSALMTKGTGAGMEASGLLRSVPLRGPR